jgi:exosortase/archaeosortase family protein
LHFFIVAMAIATLYGYLNGIRSKWRLYGLAASLAVLSNWVRVLVIVIAGHLTNMQHYLVRVEHYYFGWGVFAVAMGVFFFIARRMETLHSGCSITRSESPPLGPQRARVWVTVVALAMLVGPAWGQAVVFHARNAPKTFSRVLSPPDWTATPITFGNWNPIYEGADSVAAFAIRRAEAEVEMYVAQFMYQRHGHKLAGYGNSILGKSLRADQDVDIRTERDREGRLFNSMIAVDVKNQKWLIRYRFDAGGHSYASPTRAQIVAGLQSLITLQPSRVVAWRSRCIPDCTAAGSLLDQSQSGVVSDVN